MSLTRDLAIPGDMGFVVKVGLFSGLREDEARYIHRKEKICANNVGCRCDKLHVVHKPNGCKRSMNRPVTRSRGETIQLENFVQ